MRLLPIILLILMAGIRPVYTQEIDEETVEKLRELERSLYPSFIEGGSGSALETIAPTATPLPTPNNRVELKDVMDLAVTTPPPTIVFQPNPLINDLSSTTTWQSNRMRLDPKLDDLRIAVISGFPIEQLQQKADGVTEVLDMLWMMAPYQAPAQMDVVQERTEMIKLYLRVLEKEYSAEDSVQIQTALNLIERETAELRQLLILSDRDRGWDQSRRWILPDDWQPREFRDEAYARRIAMYNARDLTREYKRKLQRIESWLRKDPKSWDSNMADEMGEVARLLASRGNELPISSRAGFRNAALRLDVMAEALGDYLRDENYLYAKRHLRTAGWALEELEAYLKN